MKLWQEYGARKKEKKKIKKKNSLNEDDSIPSIKCAFGSTSLQIIFPRGFCP